MFCAHCGKPIAEGCNFCSNCGAKHSNSQALQQDELQTLSHLIDFFAKKQPQYDEYVALSTCIRDIHYSRTPLIFAIVLSALSPYILAANVMTLPGTPVWLFLIPAIFMLVAIFLFKWASKIRGEANQKLNEAKSRQQQIAEELYQYYRSYPNCPVSTEYTNPNTLTEIKQIILSGRASTIQDALRIHGEDLYRQKCNGFSQQA